MKTGTPQDGKRMSGIMRVGKLDNKREEIKIGTSRQLQPSGARQS